MSTDVTAPSTDTPSPIEALQQRHRKEQRDLVSRITQKKKQATKKTRKGVNDECTRLEQELTERQAEELRILNGDEEEHIVESEAESDSSPVVDVEFADLRINGPATDSTPSPTPSTTTPSTSTTSESNPAKKKNRQKERLARRKAEADAAIAQAELEARSAPNPREVERSRFEPLLAGKGLAVHEIRADGHCLYAAVADQLRERSVPVQSAGAPADAQPYLSVRYAAAGVMEKEPDAFEPFLEEGLGEYVRKIRETGEWGGHLELLALAKSYGVRICVLHSDGRVDAVEDEGKEGEREEIWLGYYRHSHGLGEHYNSLRKAEKVDS